MKFRKFGKALLMSALSVGTILGVSSCVQSYTVGFLYVTGTVTSGSTGQGIISGFKIDHNTGNLVPINGLPVSSGGAFPGRAVLITGGRFLYVLNRGVDSSTGDVCTVTTTDCSGQNIELFAIGGNGILTPQQTFYSQGLAPFRIVADSSGKFVYVLDAQAPSNDSCALALGSGVTSCADITAFQVDESTGRLTLLVNAQVTSASGAALPYFPVPPHPIDMALASSYLLTLAGTPGSTAQTGDVVFPYAFNSSNGQLTVSQNSSQPVNAAHGSAIIATSSSVYVLDAEQVSLVPLGATSPVTYQGQVLPFTVGRGGALQAQNGGAVPDDPNLTNPIMFLAESKGKWFYVANHGDDSSNQTSTSGIVGYFIDPTTKQLTFQANSPYIFGSGSGPQCLIEDPSSQFIYTANYNDSTVTGSVLDVNSGKLNPLPGKANQAFKLQGPPQWCLVSGRTS